MFSIIALLVIHGFNVRILILINLVEKLYKVVIFVPPYIKTIREG